METRDGKTSRWAHRTRTVTMHGTWSTLKTSHPPIADGSSQISSAVLHGYLGRGVRHWELVSAILRRMLIILWASSPTVRRKVKVEKTIYTGMIAAHFLLSARSVRALQPCGYAALLSMQSAERIQVILVPK